MLGLSNFYKVKPSTLLDIIDPYTSYCFDEACGFILAMMKDGKEPVFKVNTEKKKYKSFSDFYKQF